MVGTRMENDVIKNAIAVVREIKIETNARNTENDRDQTVATDKRNGNDVKLDYPFLKLNMSQVC